MSHSYVDFGGTFYRNRKQELLKDVLDILKLNRMTKEIPKRINLEDTEEENDN